MNCRSLAHLAVHVAGVAFLMGSPASFATQDPTVIDLERQHWLEGELKDAEQRVWIANRDRLVALTGPGVNRINPDPVHKELPPDRQQLEQAARRRMDAAKTVVEEIEARLAGNVADLATPHSLVESCESLPGDVTLSWSFVPGAAGYTVEVNKRRRGDELWGMWKYVTKLARPEHILEVGSARMRWRVWAVDSAGRGGPISPWSTFPRDD